MKIKYMRSLELIFNSLFHCVILFTVISLLFWLYIRKVEAKTLDNEIQRSIRNIFRDNVESNPDLRQKAKLFATQNSVILNALSESYSGPDICSINTNKVIKIMNVGFIVIMWIVVISVLSIMLMTCITNEHLYLIGYIFRQNIIIFICIGIIEFIFFLYVASKYSPIYPSEITQIVVNSVQNTPEQH